MLIFWFPFGNLNSNQVLKMDAGLNGEEPKSWDELYSIDLMPSELFLKFREELRGVRVGLNLEVFSSSNLSTSYKLEQSKTLTHSSNGSSSNLYSYKP